MHQGNLETHIRNQHSFDRSSNINDETLYESGSEFHISDDEADQDEEEEDGASIYYHHSTPNPDRRFPNAEVTIPY